MALTDSPPASLRRIAVRSFSLVFGGLPSRTPCARARASPACVRSTIRSRSISANAASIASSILPAEFVRSVAPSCVTNTRTPSALSCFTVC